MKITHVDAIRVAVPPADPPFRWREGLSGSPATGDGAVLRIGTDTGAEGVAFLGRPGAGAILPYLAENVFQPELVGADPLQREWLWHRMWELDRIHEFPLYVLGLVDTALWDLAARLQGEPVWRLLGGYRTEIPAYASTTTFADIPEFLDVADQALALGYRGIKLHAWGDARRDAELAVALRAHVGPDVPLMYDGSAGFDLPDALRLGHALAEADYLWYEEPMREFSVTAYAQLARSVRVPLLVGETSDGAHYNTADFIRAGAATFGVRTSTNLRGGITGAMRIAHLADSFLLRAEVHGSDVPTHHLCMAIPNTTYYESLITSNPVRREAAVGPDGLLRAATAPGIALPAGIDYPAHLEEFAA
jgi:L-alanine-DL-glutamate epimerase-like enolase superfamily enzyme